jgi:hypothetical protein
MRLSCSDMSRSFFVKVSSALFAGPATRGGDGGRAGSPFSLRATGGTGEESTTSSLAFTASSLSLSLSSSRFLKPRTSL